MIKVLRLFKKRQLPFVNRGCQFSTEQGKEEIWQKVFKTSSHDFLGFLGHTSLSALSSLFFNSILIPSVFLGAATVHLIKLKAQPLEIDHNATMSEIKIRKKGVFRIRDRIFKKKEIEYVYSTADGRIFLTIFKQNDEFFVYLVPVMADPKNFDRCLELMNEMRKISIKNRKK